MSTDRRQSGLWSRNPETGFYEVAPVPSAQIQPKGPYAYYEPPARQPYQPQPKRFSFSERAGPQNGDESLIPTQNGISRTASKKERGIAAAKDAARKIAEPVEGTLNEHPETTSDQLAETKHVNSTALPSSARQKPLRVDPDYVPNNLRAKAWSPDVVSPKQRTRNTSNASSKIPDATRKGSVPGQSPLQSLEAWSKEEKRARVEQAETKARQRSVAGEGNEDLRRSATLRSERGRVVSDGVARTASQPNRQNERRQVSNPTSSTAAAAAQRFQNASNALRQDGRQQEPLPGQAVVQPAAPAQAEYGHREELDRAVDTQAYQERPRGDNSRGSVDLGRSQSGKYKHRARDAGFAGAAAAYSAGRPMSSHEDTTERSKTTNERWKASHQNDQISNSSVSTEHDRNGIGIGRSGSKKLQKRSPVAGDYSARDQLQADRTGPSNNKRDVKIASAHQEPDPIPPSQVQNPAGTGVKYSMPPQTAAGQQAIQQVGFHPDVDSREHHHRFGDMFQRRDHRGYVASTKPLEDWRQAKTARLTIGDLDLEQTESTTTAKDDSAWWEKGKRSSSAGARAMSERSQQDGAYEEKAQNFEPFLFLKCGPLLRYTGIRHEAVQGNTSTATEVWRGTIMIVTDDSQSDLSRTPVLRIFAQPMDLAQQPPPHLVESGQELPPEFEDPVAGQVKLSRTGRPVYVRPVHDIKGEVDLSREENNRGLFSATRTPVLGPQASTGADGRQSQHITFQDKSRVKKRDGERAGRYRDVKAIRLHTERGFTFWRFSIEVELRNVQTRIAYRINNGPAMGFWVPAKGETMNIMFHSCNGFSMSVDASKFSGPDPLWRDVLNRHQYRPFHVMIGGGDQIYNDAAMRDTVLFKEWLSSRNPEHKHSADFSPAMQDELEDFYLNRYAMWFSQGLFGMANGQIPMVNVWDDHDIIDGYGSYPHHFMSTRIFTGLGAVAYKYYMLFQHQSLSTETEKEEPSWLLGKSPGPYINELSRSIFLSLGNKVSFVGLDCRTERMRDEVLSAETYNNIFDRCQDEIVKGQTRHLIVLLGVPIAYPRLNFLENVLTSRAMTPIKALGKTGLLGGFVNKFDGGVEILDDLDDHWTAKHHKGERNWFIEELQELAAEKSVRVTILGGDVHLGAVGQFYSPKKLGIAKDRDHRYMPNIVSSAIVNTPPPTAMADVLNKRNKVHHLNTETDEDMIPMFSHDVDGSRRNNNHLLPRRNFCIIREYVPGSTRPSTPVHEVMEPDLPTPDPNRDVAEDHAGQDRRFPPGSMKRTMSLTRGPMNLVRRLSGSSKSRPPISAPFQNASLQGQDTSGPRRSTSVSYAGSTQPDGRPTFYRRPTNLSEKEAKKAITLDGRDPGHIDLEGGLDISLCMEADQTDPAGKTVRYRLLVPALWYDGPADPNTAKFKGHRGSFMERLRWNRKREKPAGDDENWSGSEHTRTPSPSRTSLDPVTERNTAANALGLTSTGRGALSGAGPYNALGQNGTGPRDATPRAPLQGDIYGRNISAPISGSLQTNRGSDQAYIKGYNFSSLPSGAENDRQHYPITMQSQFQTQSANTRPYEQSGNRRSSAPSTTQTYGPSQAMTGTSRRGNDAAYHGYRSDESFTASEDYSDEEYEAHRRQKKDAARRGSKTERFFGIGDSVRDAVSGGGRRSMQVERPPMQEQEYQDNLRYSLDQGRPTGGELSRGDSVKQGKNWKIWQKGWYPQKA